MANPIIEMRNLVYKRNGRAIFDGIDLAAKAGQITAIMGPSGAGKTTLLRLIGGQLKPNRGEVLVQGQHVSSLGRDALYTLRKRVGMLFQSGALFTDLNVFENVAFPLREHTELPEELIRDVVLLKLEAVGLRGAHHLMPSELSGGMARRVALARAIALDPEIILYDEPFAGQDPISMGVLIKLIQMLNQVLKMTTVIVSHDVAEVMSIADYVYLLGDGKILGEGSPESLHRSNSEWVAQFMKGLPDGPVPFHYPAPTMRDDMLRELV